jgi:hypothetical protein
MQFFLAFNGVMLVLAIGVLGRIVPVKFLTGFITAVHYTIGISTPTEEQVRRAIIVWIVSVVLIVDVVFSLLRWVY